MQQHEDAQCQMSDAEVMAVAMVAALSARGHFALPGRLPRLTPGLLTLFALLGEQGDE
jgi:hypothetical protein